ncbi:hypothetical protein [Actinopolyspora erythraea]|uniref:hypothetical protein n=1 Tax=Actinopolyspora erythraea TaxID=414996 RepID=UPI00118578BC|nr:hypothetical protein [Actinopolyspora erythraea]
MKQQAEISGHLQAVAEKYFNPIDGEALMLVDEFNSHPMYADGQRRGLQDTFSILMGLSDHFWELAKEEEQNQ